VDRLRRKRLDDEIRHHIEERAARLVAEGMDAGEALREAERAFGDVGAVRAELEQIEEPPRGALALLFDRVRTDLAFAGRQLRRAPGFAAVAILTLGLGIGSATAIFGLVKAVVLDPLPYPQADRIVVFNQETPDGLRFSVSEPDFRDFRSRVRSVELLTAVSRADLTYIEDGRPVNVVAMQVTGSFFPLFGGTATTLGRAFTDQESGERARKLVVVSHAFWAEDLGGDPDVVGTSLVLDDMPYEVVGVAPRGWAPPMAGDVWIPITFADPDRTDHNLDAVGRLAAGATLGSASADADAVAAELGREHPDTNGGWGTQLRPLKSAVLGPRRIQAAWVLLGAVGLLLLLACASVSNLLLARASGRGREMDLRGALGASRRRLVQQLLTESSVLASAGAVVGILFAYALLPGLQAMSPADTPRIGEASVDAVVVLAAAAAALLTGLVFGLAPVVHVLRGNRTSARSAGRVTGGSGRARAGLVAAQVAVSVTLLFGTGVLGASFLRLQRVDPGMDVDHTLVVPLMLSGDRYSVAERRVTVDALHARLASLPGVEAVGSSNIIPFSGANTAVDVNVEGQPTSPDAAPFAPWRAVSRTYLDAAGLELLHGRTFEAPDFDEGAADVVVVTRTLARQLFGDPASAVGRRIAFGWDGTNYRRIVGVVSDLEDRELAGAPPATFFMPAAGFMNWSVFLVRFRPGAPLVEASEVRRAVWDVDPNLPVPTVERLADRVGGSVTSPRFNVLVMGMLGIVALVLSVMAIYGLILFAVRQRTREIGVRLALGARASGVVALLLRRGLVITAAGTAVGALLSLGLSRYLDSLLFGEVGSRVPTLLAAAVVVTFTALAATWIPARRASRVDPREALGAE